MARQGHAFSTAQEVRVVYQDDGDEFTDVPADGKTVGEIVTRGNIVMKEVICVSYSITLDINIGRNSAVLPRSRGHEESFPRRLLPLRGSCGHT